MNPANRSIIQASEMTSSIHARNRWRGILGLLLLLAVSGGTIAAGEAQALPAPEIKPQSGAYAIPVQAEIAVGGGRGVEVRYTVDGTEPTATSWLVRGPVIITDDTVIKARAFAPGSPSQSPSSVTSATYRVTAPFVSARPIFAPPAGLYVDTVRVALSSPTAGTWIAYTTDGSEPTLLSPRYVDPIAVLTPTTVRARAFAFNGWFTAAFLGRTVRLQALFPSGVATASYNLQVGTPVFSVVGGLYRDPQSVTVTSPTPAAVLTYTTDGSEPTSASPRLSGPIAVARSQSIRVRGFRDGFVPSAVATAAYELKVRDPTVAPPGGTYSADTITATITSNDAASDTRFTVDGTAPSASSPPVPAAVDVRESLTLTVRSFRDGWTPSDAVVSAYRLRVTTPVVSPAGGAYTEAATVTASVATAAAVMRYTVDGTDPSVASPIVPAVLTIDHPTILRVVGFRDGFEPSDVASARFDFYVATPSAALAPGTYRTEQAASFACATTSATLTYTTDGTDPSPTSAAYVGPIAIAQSEVIRVRGFRDGFLPSAVLAAAYELKAPEPTVAPAGGTFTDVTTAAIQVPARTTVRYTVDGTAPAAASPAAPVVLDVTRSETLTVRAFRDGWTASDPVAATFVLQVATPSLDPTPGDFFEATPVMATSATPSAFLRYTTDGSDPTETSPALPQAGVSVERTTSIAVRGFRDGFESSQTAGGLYRFPPMISFVTEASSIAENGGTVVLNVQLSEPAEREVSFSYALVGGEVVAADCGPITEGVRVVIPIGATSAAIHIPIVDDAVFEADQTAVIALTDWFGAVHKPGHIAHVITIIDNDPPPTVAFAQSTGTFTEEVGLVQVALALSAACEVAVDVDLLSASGTAASDVDFMSIERRIRFEPGQTTVSCPVMLLDDGEAEGDEHVALTLRQSGPATVGSPSSYRLVITSAERRLETVAWQQKAQAVVAHTNTDPPAAARMYALLGVAQRRAARAADGTSVSPQGAVVAASARVLSRAFPALAQSFAVEAQADVASPNWSGYPLEDVTGATAPGRVIADRVMDAAASDGAGALWAGTPPVGAGYWYASWAYAQPPLRPLWGQVRPWFLASGDEYRPAPPPAFGSSAFVTALTEVRTIADHRTDEQLLIAGKWSDGPGTPTPAGKWCSIAGDLALQHGLGEAEAAQLFGLLGATMMDASIACWDAKYAYWLIRPYQADRSINTPIGQPNFPSYVSGHATFSGAASEILAHAFPDSAASVRAMAEEAAMSRLYGSIHYRFDNEAGLVLGRQVAAQALADDADGSWLREITPQVAFVFPAPAQILGSGTVAIQASISDDGALDAAAVTATLRSAAGSLVPATVTIAPGSSVATATVTVTPASPLREGIYQTIVSATDADGHVGSGRLSFGVDPNGAPVVTILTPTDRDLVGMDIPVVLTGRVNQPVAAATVNGTEIVVGGDLTFSVSLTVDPNTGIRRPLTLMGGLNELLVRATDASGKSGTARIDVLVDDHAPTIAIESPTANSQTTAAAVHVAGRVQDLVLGQVTSDNMTVTVNGLPAEIRSGNFLHANVPLAPGINQIAVVARDQSGNLSQTVVTVTQVPTRGIRMDLAGGDLQEAETRTQLGQPLAVRLTDPLGAAVDRHPVTFMVSRGDGQLAGSTDDERRKLTVLTDANGEARTQFVLGGNAGVGNQRVTATSMGVLSGVTFTASATHGPITAVYTMMGDRQTGFAGQAVPWPLVVSVQDFAGNPAAGVAVRFQVQGGTSALVPAQWVNAIFRNPQAIVAPQQAIEVVTDLDGRAAATVVLGSEVGPEVAEVKASVVGHPEARTTTLVASAVSGTGNPADTSLVGTVLSTEHQPIQGVTLVIEGTTIGAVSGADGRFAIIGAPAGHRHLLVNGTTANRGAIRYPTIGFEVDLLSGATISLPMPIYLPTMDRSNEVLAGGDEEVTLQLPGMPGVEVIIAPHSTIRADGVRGPVWMWTSPVNAQAIPMPPPGGIVPTLAATLQPSGTRLDPPARIRWPNMQGMLPGSQAFMLSFDHDLGAFVSQGTITVSDDGAYMTSDAGSGLSKAGWHFPCDTPIPTGDAEGECPQELSISGPSEVLIGVSFAVRAVNGGPLPLSLPLRWSAPAQPGTLPDGTRVTFSLRVDRAEGDHADVTIIADREVPMGTKSTLTIFAMPAKVSAKASLVVTPLEVTAAMMRFIAVDGNRDGVLTFAEDDAVSAAHPWRWWVNDDADQPGAEIDSAADTPGSGTNATSLQVNGLRDLVDWFPLGIDVPALVNYFPPAQGYTYRLAVGPLAVVPTTLGAESAFDYLTKAHSTGFGYLLTQVPEDAQVQSVDGATGTVAVPKIMALNATGQVFLAEGKRSGADAVELQVWDAQKKTVIQQKVPLSVSSVKNMYRWINLRHAVGKTDEQRATNAVSEPANYPDSMANGKMVVWIHGFNVPEVGGEAWGAEMFKRLYQAGSKAMFTAVHWAGDESARLGGIAGAAEYYLAVERAILTAPVYAQEIEHLPGDSKVLISHSLGAGVVSEAIAHRGLTNFSRYIMIDGALPVEALDAQQAPDPIMIHPQWRDYPQKTQVSNWYQSFTTAQPQDARSHLRWRGQFQEMVATGKLSLMYSSGEEVLGNVPAQKADAFWFKVMGAFTPNEPFYSAGARYSWATSEWSKGRSGSWARLALSQWAGAGWGINPERMTIGVDPISQRVDLIPPTAADVAALTDKELRQKPVFAPFNLAKISGYEHDPSALDGPSGATVASDHRVRAKLLGCAIPAVTLAVGANGLKDANGNFIGDNYDMQAGRNGWLSKKKYPEHQNWFHSDIKDVAYLYVHPVIRHLTDISSIGAP